MRLTCRGNLCNIATMSKATWSQKLKNWMAASGTTGVALAVSLDAPESRVSEWRSGRKLPGHDRMLEVVRLSGGVVPYYCQHCGGGPHG